MVKLLMPRYGHECCSNRLTPTCSTRTKELDKNSLQLPDVNLLEQPLSSEQVDEFFRQGFLVIGTPQIPASELEWCREILMRMILGGERRTAGRNNDLAGTNGAGDKTSPRLLQPSMYARGLRKVSYPNIARRPSN